jgi:tetratricopeptide (TPR) repeat protein
MEPVMGMIVRTIAALACAWTLYAWVWVPHYCSVQLTELARRTDGAAKTAGDYERTVRARANVAELARLRESAPIDVRVPMLIAGNQMLMGLREEAVRSYEEALHVDPRPEIFMARGDALVQLGRVDEAIESYATAVQFDARFLDLVAPGILQDRIKARASSKELIIRRF